MRKNKHLLIALCLFVMIVYSQHIYDSNTDYFKKKNVFLALPSSKSLKILSLGNSEFVADMIYLWSIQFFSNYTLLNAGDFIEDIYNLITDVAPKYLDPYLIGSTIMVMELGRTEMAIRLLQKGSENIKDEWIFDFDSGYYASKYLKDFKRAEKYYKKASEIKNAPKFLKRMLLHSVYMQGRLEESWKLWQEVLDNAKSDLEVHSARLHLYQIKFELDKRSIKSALDRFHKRYGFYPKKIDELCVYGYIKKIPKDFKGNSYKYDSKKGTIDPEAGYMWKK